MALQFSRSEPARQIEARARARGKGARVEVVTPGEHYQARSLSRPGVVHELRRTRSGWTCTCEGFTFTACCLHLGQLERRAEREGWALGFRVAPRSRMAA